jgi:hypothetical protein
MAAMDAILFVFHKEGEKMMQKEETLRTFCISCKVENLHREGKSVYVGVFDMNQRLEKTRKVLREKQHLKKLIEEDIRELEKDVKELEEMMTNSAPSLQR